MRRASLSQESASDVSTTSHEFGTTGPMDELSSGSEVEVPEENEVLWSWVGKMAIMTRGK